MFKITVCSIRPLVTICQATAWLILLLTGCGSTPPPPQLGAGAVVREATVTLPTPAPTLKPSPVSTRVLPVESLTPGPTPSQTPLPNDIRGLVVAVLDGHTIEVVLEGDRPNRAYQVRYLGIDTPPNDLSDPWGVVAYETNRQLTSGKVVRLQKDQSDTDEAGHLLRHVYLNNQLVSLLLTEQGLARAKTTEPDTRFKVELEAAAKKAQAAKLGLWGPPPTPTPRLTVTIAVTPTITVTVTAVIKVTPKITTEVTPAGTSAPETGPEATVTGEANKTQ